MVNMSRLTRSRMFKIMTSKSNSIHDIVKLVIVGACKISANLSVQTGPEFEWNSRRE